MGRRLRSSEGCTIVTMLRTWVEFRATAASQTSSLRRCTPLARLCCSTTMSSGSYVKRLRRRPRSSVFSRRRTRSLRAKRKRASKRRPRLARRKPRWLVRRKSTGRGCKIFRPSVIRCRLASPSLSSSWPRRATRPIGRRGRWTWNVARARTGNEISRPNLSNAIAESSMPRPAPLRLRGIWPGWKPTWRRRAWNSAQLLLCPRPRRSDGSSRK
mmetsp:Transcript_3920/g.10020  ORF Transcript_3920/g.10020 Transcript_3920/m.10020 type:complete len:214 (-) Transcript_3920:1302-1943(-)